MPIRLLQSSEALIRWHSSLGDSLLWPRNTPIPKKPAVNTTNQGDDAGDIFQSHNPAPAVLAPDCGSGKCRQRRRLGWLCSPLVFWESEYCEARAGYLQGWNAIESGLRTTAIALLASTNHPGPTQGRFENGDPVASRRPSFDRINIGY